MRFKLLFKPRTLLREMLGMRTLEDRMREVEQLVRLWASRSGESTALDLLIDRVDALVARLPADAATQRLTADLQSQLRVRDRADEVALLHQRIDQLEERLLESHEEIHERSRRRWRDAQPDDRLTWMQALTGDAFVDKLEAYGAFAPGHRVLEVGPGYGRLIKTVLERDLPFASYHGVDLSAKNVAALRQELDDPRLSFLNTDVEVVELEDPLDLVYSSLTFKHFYPSFEAALLHLGRQMKRGAFVIFDLVEGHKRYFEADGVTYLRFYERQEARDILERANFELVAFDEVLHDPTHPRLLVVARRP